MNVDYLVKTGICGAGDNHSVYPTMTYDWTSITKNNIMAGMKDDYILLANDNHKYTDGATDQFILAKKI